MTAGAAVLRLYDASPWPVRAHVRVRWATCPFPRVASFVPRRGRVLDVGCGHGLLSLLLAVGWPEREVVGIDVDGPKIEAARAAAARAVIEGADLSFDVVDGPAVPDGAWDAVTIVDVLYLLPRDAQERLLRECASRLADTADAVLVVKEIDVRPRWKYALALAQELTAVRLARITAGSSVRFLPPEVHAGWLRDAGLEVDAHALDDGYPYPHHLLVARHPRMGKDARHG